MKEKKDKKIPSNLPLFKVTEGEWVSLTKNSDSILFTPKWQYLLKKSFGIETIYLYNKHINDGTIIQVFRKGPFKVGYAGFPTGGTINGNPISSLNISSIKKLVSSHIHELRIYSSGFKQPELIESQSESLPETTILELNNYDSLKIAKVRRDVNRSIRFNVSISETNLTDQANNMFRLYEQTIRRNKGIIKYNLRYFIEILNYSTSSPNISILNASIKGKYAGFLILLNEATTAYYLHGAVDEAFRSKGVSDLLIHEAIRKAQSLGATHFNMMPSPIEQPSLVRYKEKWGAETRSHKTFKIPIDTFWSYALTFATSCNTYYQKIIS